MPTSYSLQQRLLMRTLGAVLVVWLATAAFVGFEAAHEVDELLDAHLAQSAALLVVQQSARDLEDDDDSDKEPELSDAPSLHKYAHRVAYQVFENERLVMHSPNVSHLPMSPQRKGFVTTRLSDTGLSSTSDGQVWRVFASPGRTPAVQIYVAERVDSRDDILRAVLLGFGPPLLLGLPLLLLVLWWNVRSGLQPLQRLRQALTQRDTQTLDPVVVPHAPQEVQPVLRALNDLLQRLAQRLELERRFTADAAHELRTPIAAIRAQAQVALGVDADRAQQVNVDADTNANASAVRQQALRDTLAGCDRASRVVEQLLTLARVDSPQSGAQTAPQALSAQPFDVCALLQQLLAELTPQALQRQQQIELIAPEACTVQGQDALWHILLRNLVDNALRYSPVGATVRIAVQRQPSGAVALTVQDSGPGLAPEHVARLGERFFRVLDTQATGSGLGWSIVRHIAAVQGIAVQVGASPELGGLRVALDCPAPETITP